MISIEYLQRELELPTVIYHASVVSTNDWTRQFARSHSPDLPALVVAEEQTGGRGRGDNRWHSDSGSLTFSLLISANNGPRDFANRSLWPIATAVAICEAIRSDIPDCPVGIKWPNDLILDGRKLGGILIESVPQRTDLLVVGVGVNVNTQLECSCDDIDSAAISLAEWTGTEIGRSSLLVSMVSRMVTTLSSIAEHPAEIVARANELCIHIDAEVRCQTAGDECTTGRCVAIDPSGGIGIESGGKYVVRHTGNLVFRKTDQN